MMGCETSTRPVVSMTVYGPRAVHAECLRYIRGIRGKRNNPVTRKQIGEWMLRTPAEGVDIALIELVAENRVTVSMLSLRTPRNSANRAYGYEFVQEAS